MTLEALLKNPPTEKVTYKQISDLILLENYPCFLLDITMRGGKSTYSINLVKKWMLEGSCEKVLIIVPQSKNIEDWKVNIQKHNPDLKDYIDIICYASLKKYDEEGLLAEYDTILVDEADCMNGEVRSKALFNAKAHHWVFMSGSWNLKSRQMAKEIVNGLGLVMKTVTISLKDAVRIGLLSKPEIICVSLPPKEELMYVFELKRYNRPAGFSLSYRDFRSKYTIEGCKFSVNIDCTYAEYCELLDEEIAFVKSCLDAEFDKVNRIYNEKKKMLTEQVFVGNIRNEIKRRWGIEEVSLFNSDGQFDKARKGYTQTANYIANALLRLYRVRKGFSAQSKMAVINTFKNLAKDKKVLFFTDSVAASKALCEDNYFSGDLSKKELKLRFDRFESGEINHIAACAMLGRGTDFEELDYAVCCQLAGETGENFQKVGRSFLVGNPKIIIFYNPDEKLQDVKYLQKFLRLFEREWVFNCTFDQLKTRLTN
ncbi:MAG: helicase-related protein [Waterburya sp.]